MVTSATLPSAVERDLVHHFAARLGLQPEEYGEIGLVYCDDWISVDVPAAFLVWV